MKASFVKAHVENISIYNYNFIVLLRGEHSEQVLPICIGPAEAHSIAAAFHNKPSRRPLTHDLMKSVLEDLECDLDKILVTDLKEGTFYARLFLKAWDGRTLEVDSRPSDAIALAIRYGAAIYVRKDILEENSVELSDHEDEQIAAAASREAQEDSAEEQDVDPVSALKKKLDAAIQEERYEEAALLRDEIQKLMGN